MINEMLNKIKEYNRIIIHRHIRPDGDCIGCQHALKKAIELNFPEKEVYAVGDIIPPYLSEYGALDMVSDDMYEGSLVIVVDTATIDRICDDRYKLGDFLIKIDHHDDSPCYADINYIDAAMPACGAIMVRLFKEWGFKLNKEIATYLFIAIVTDTGRFRFRGINSELMANAGYLLEYGVDTEKLYTGLYLKEDKIYRLQAYVYSYFKRTKNGVAYIHFTKDMMEKYDVTRDDAANLVSCLDSIKGSLIWVAFVDQMKESDPSLELDPADEVRVRIRSRFVSVNDVARNYRGGGHLQACGATIYSKKEKKSLLKDLDKVLYIYKKEHPEAE